MHANLPAFLLDDINFVYSMMSSLPEKIQCDHQHSPSLKGLVWSFFGELLLFIELLRLYRHAFRRKIHSSPGKIQPSFAKTKQTKKGAAGGLSKKGWCLHGDFPCINRSFLVPLIGGR